MAPLRFDIRNDKSALRFLVEWLDLSINQLMLYIRSNSSGIDIDNFLTSFKINIDRLKIDGINYVVSHVTTSIDDMKFMKSHGLMDLATLLSVDSPLKLYLNSQGAKFDIENLQLSYKENIYSIDFYSEDKPVFVERESLEGRLESIAHKICYDNQISAFFTMEGDKIYAGLVHLRPEFLYNVSKFCKTDMETEWINNAKSYVIEFEGDFEMFEWFTFYDYKEDYLNDINGRSEHKKWLIRKALYVLWNYFYYNDYSENYAYVRKDYIVPWSNVITVRDI